MFRSQLQSLLVKGMDEPPKMKTVTESDYLYNPAVGAYTSPFDAVAATYDISGNVMYETKSDAHSEMMHQIHRSEPVDNDVSKALDCIIKGEFPEPKDDSEKDDDDGDDDDKLDDGEKDPQKEEVEKEMKKKSLTVESALDDLSKSGEGSKGGKVVGHGKDGKPIYQSTAKPAPTNDSFRQAGDMVRGARVKTLLDAFTKSVDSALNDLIKAGA